jgi:hypothetical protein
MTVIGTRVTEEGRLNKSVRFYEVLQETLDRVIKNENMARESESNIRGGNNSVKTQWE